jgi:hypothetical protein
MNITLSKLSAVFEKDLGRIKAEINQYPTNESLWKVASGINNSGGTLTLHICGNLQHFIGAMLGETRYIRDRSAEFASKGFNRSELIELIDTTHDAIVQSMEKLQPADLDLKYPVNASFGPDNMTIMQAFVILAAHLNYHLGQINYHRRLLT